MVTNLVNLFPYGRHVKMLVDSVVQQQAPVYSILRHLVLVRQNVILASNNTEKSAWEELAVKLLRKYYLLIAVGLWLHERQDKEYMPFVQWLEVTPTVYDLYNSINTGHIDQYLSVNCELVGVTDSSEMITTNGLYSDSLIINRYLNVHTLLLQQQVTDQDNVIVAKQLVLSCPTHQSIFGTIFTKSLVCPFLRVPHRTCTRCFLRGNTFLPWCPNTFSS